KASERLRARFLLPRIVADANDGGACWLKNQRTRKGRNPWSRMTNFLFVKDMRGPLCTGRSLLATTRSSGRRGWESGSVAVCSMRTARFDEDIWRVPMVKNRRLATGAQGITHPRGASGALEGMSLPLSGCV